jgi:hypothetical protein
MLIEKITNLSKLNASFVVSLITLLFLFVSAAAFLILCKNETRKIADRETDKNISVFIILGFVSSIFIFHFVRGTGGAESQMYLMLILQIILIIKDRALFLIPLMSVVTVLMHDKYTYLYFAVILALLLYRTAFSQKKMRYAIILAVTALLVFSLTVYMEFFSFVTHSGGINELMSRYSELQIHRDIPFATAKNWFEAIYFHDVKAYPMGIKTLWPLIIGYIVTLSPMAILLFMFFKKTVLSCDGFLKKLVIVLIGLMPIIATIPIFVVQTDYHNYTLAIIAYYFFTIISLVLLDKKIRAIFNAGMRRLIKNPIYISLIITYVFLVGISGVGKQAYLESFLMEKCMLLSSIVKQAFSVIF